MKTRISRTETKKVRVVEMLAPKPVKLFGLIYWEARDRYFPEAEYGRAHRYINGHYVGKFK